MKNYIITEKELQVLKNLKEIKEEKQKDLCPFYNQWWDMECPYLKDKYCENTKCGGISVNPGNGDSFCAQLIELCYACKTIFEKSYHDQYIDYVEAKIDIKEIPLTYKQWLQMEEDKCLTY